MHPQLPASPSLPIFVTGHPEHKGAERGSSRGDSLTPRTLPEAECVSPAHITSPLPEAGVSISGAKHHNVGISTQEIPTRGHRQESDFAFRRVLWYLTNFSGKCRNGDFCVIYSYFKWKLIKKKKKDTVWGKQNTIAESLRLLGCQSVTQTRKIKPGFLAWSQKPTFRVSYKCHYQQELQFV